MNSPNPNSLKSRFTKGLLRALVRINKHQTASSYSYPAEIRRRYLRIKVASYASMASAVGTRRAWSRALLRKIQNQGGVRRIGRSSMKKRSAGKKMKRASELRKVVPGGEGMDTWRLLEETAHYMKCLTTQVKAMRTILENYSSTT